MNESTLLLVMIILFIVGYYLYNKKTNRIVHTRIIKYDPYLNRIDGVYGRPSPLGIPKPYPHLTGNGTEVLLGSPEWIL